MFGNCYIQQPPSPWMDVGSQSAENMWNSSELICLLEENPRSFLPIDKFRIRSPIQGYSWLGDVPSQLLSREGQDMCLQGHLPALNFLLLLNWWVVHFLGGKGHLWNNSSLHVPQSPGAKMRQLEDYATSDQRCRAHLIRREHSIAIFWKTQSSWGVTGYDSIFATRTRTQRQGASCGSIGSTAFESLMAEVYMC